MGCEAVCVLMLDAYRQDLVCNSLYRDFHVEVEECCRVSYA